jgi:UDPglucose--hexose-1-phosphate uridylyltransferase
MSLLRYDPATNDWVVFSPERSRRPHDAGGPPTAPSSGAADCPFCPGHEDRTPPEILSRRDGPGGSWTVRVIPNKFAVLSPSSEHEHVEEGPLFRRLGGYGAHEIVIEAPEHDRFLGHQPVEQIDRVLRALHARFNALAQDTRLRAVVAFKNHGAAAGTSLRHPHWQIIATPVVPRQMRVKSAIATDYFDRTGRCVYCDLLTEERAAGIRVIVAGEDYTAVLPYASATPYQVRVMPRVHRASFGRVPEEELGRLAPVLREVLGRLYAGLGDPAFNLTIATAPRGDEHKPSGHWHVDILPRLTTPAGFELGSGMAINTVLPEDAAEHLRRAVPAAAGNAPATCP